MIRDPFTILHPFADQLGVGLWDKVDDVRGDQAAADTLDSTKAAGLHQVHGNRVIIVREPILRTQKADGMITDVPDLTLCIRWADCQNFVVFCPEKRVAGVLHAGWRGIEAGAIGAFFRILYEEWGIRGEDVYVGAGPSLCKRCADFTDPVRELPHTDPAFKDGKHVDLQEAATHAFFQNGVVPEHFERSPDCTRCHPELYWTYRGGHREEVKTGHTNMLACVLREKD
jgi:hypothetical protein